MNRSRKFACDRCKSGVIRSRVRFLQTKKNIKQFCSFECKKKYLDLLENADKLKKRLEWCSNNMMRKEEVLETIKIWEDFVNEIQ